MSNNPLSPLWANIFNRKLTQQERIATLWADTPLFRGVPKREIRNLADHMHPRRYQPEEVIFHDGDLGVGAALILSGSVDIRSGASTIVTLEAGDFFGEVALVAEETRTADAVAATDAELVFFLRLDLDEWLERKPRLGARMVVNLASVLAKRLGHANQRLREFQEAAPCDRQDSAAAAAGMAKAS